MSTILFTTGLYLLAVLPEDYVTFGYAVLRNGIWYAIRDNGMYCSGVRDYFVHGLMFKYVFAWGWAYAMPNSPFMDHTPFGANGDVWHTNAWLPMVVAVILAGLAGYLHLSRRLRLPLKVVTLFLSAVVFLVVALAAPAVALKLASANVFTLVKIDSLFFFFVYYVYSVAVLHPVTNLISGAASKL